MTTAGHQHIRSYPDPHDRSYPDIVVLDVNRDTVATWRGRGYRAELVREPKGSSPGAPGGDGVDPVAWVRRNPGICVIATPTRNHAALVQALGPLATHLVVEKPLTLNRSELAWLESRPDLLDSAFALSYYSLEKALPVTYLFGPRPVFSSKLVLEHQGALSPHEITIALDELDRVDISLLEGHERSPVGEHRIWTEAGGETVHLGETALHVLVVLAHVLPEERRHIEWTSLTRGYYAPRRSQLAAQGLAMSPSLLIAEGVTKLGARVHLRVGKYVPPKERRRGGTAQFRGGRVVFDFDTEECSVFRGEGPAEWKARTAASGLDKYATQMSLVMDWIHSNRSPRDFDDLPAQMWALREWFRLSREADVRGIEVEYSTELPT